MWRNIKIGFGVSLVSLSLGMTIASSFAQDRTGGNAGSTTTENARDDGRRGFDMGWIGLAGLAGLAGLMGRDRRDRKDNDVRR